MERIVSVLNDIDDKADKIIAAAASVKASMYEEHLRKVSEYEASLLSETDSKLLEIKKEKETALDQKKQQIDETCSVRLKEMKDNYDQNHDVIVDNIFNRIIEV